MTTKVLVTPDAKEAWSLADLQAVGCGNRSTIWRLQRTDASFPKPIAIRGLRRWIPDEIRVWLRSRPRAGLAA